MFSPPIVGPRVTVENRLSKLEEHVTVITGNVAGITGKIAGHWAMQTRDEYEKEFRASVKHDLREFAWKFLAGAIAVLAGIGLGLMYYTVNRVFDDKNKASLEKLETDLIGRFNTQVGKIQNEREWLRFQENGTDRKRLAEFYKELDDQENPKFIEKKRELIAKALQSFREAIEIDPKQATSHYELGELNYSFPKRLDLKDMVNEPEAIRHYEEALKWYSPLERARGWKGECYLNLGKIYHAWAVTGLQDRKYNLDRATMYLENGRTEYYDFGPRSRQDVRDSLTTIENLLKELQSTP